MGAHFTYQVVPQCVMTDERVLQLQKLMASIVTGPDQTYINDQGEEYSIDMLLALALKYWGLNGRRDVSGIYLDDYVPHYITGGMSWGDAPTDAYETMDSINACPPMFELLETWALEDRNVIRNVDPNKDGGEARV